MKHTMAKLIAIILITISLLFCVSCTYKSKSIYEENGIKTIIEKGIIKIEINSQVASGIFDSGVINKTIYYTCGG